jgi:hypothetical protein
MVIIHYCPEGEAVSDFAVEEWFEEVKRLRKRWGDDDLYREVSTTLPVSRVRVAINEGDLSPEDVLFVFRGEELVPTANGRLHRWPEGFCDAEQKLLERLL